MGALVYIYITMQGLVHMFILIFILICSFSAEWPRPKGCLISRITSRKLATNYRALSRKMTYKDKTSYESLPPYSTCSMFVGHFPQTRPVISGSFAKRDLQLKASYASSRHPVASRVFLSICRCILIHM